MRGDITQLVGGARLGCQHPACACAGGSVTLLQLHLPATSYQLLAQSLGRFLGAARHIGFSTMTKGLEALLADVFLVIANVRQVFGRMTGHTQAGADDQKRQNQQKPPGAVNRIELERQKQLRPERTELVDVIGQRLMLLEYRANDRSNTDDRQQRNRKAHGTQQFHGRAHRL